jgi:PilZ domain
MGEIRVECYAGYRSDERPLRFVIRGREFLVQELDGRWYSSEASYFRVRADDGNYYVLRHDEPQDSWALDGCRAVREEEMSSRVSEIAIRAEKRRYPRVLVPEGLEIRVTGGRSGARVDGVATVISQGGMFVRTPAPLQQGSGLTLQMVCPSVAFEAVCCVKRISDTGMGVEYTALTSENEKKLQGLVAQLQR